MDWIKYYLIAFFTFLLIDALWLGVIAKDLYQKQLGHLLGPINWGAAGLFYLIYIFGIVYFAIKPAIQSGCYVHALINGALLGFIAYATYDLTNLATLKKWPVMIVVYDLLWGTIISAATAWITFSISRFWKA